MSNWFPKVVRIVLALCIVINVDLEAGQDEERLAKNAERIRQFLPLAYPELEYLSFEVSTDARRGRSLVFAQTAGLAIEASVVEGQILEVDARGEHLHTAELESLATELTKRRASYAEMRDALRRLGVRFGPDQRKSLLQSLKLQRFRSVFGRLRVQEARFAWLDENDTKFSIGALSWFIDAEGTRPDGQRMCYRFVFEPFEGRLSWLHASKPWVLRGETRARCHPPA